MTDNDFKRTARAWLEDGPTVLSERVVRSALDEIHLTRQRRSWWPALRLRMVDMPIRTATAAIVLIAVGVVAFNLLPGGGFGGRVPPSPSPLPSPTPAATPVTIGVPPQRLDPGTYRFRLDVAPTVRLDLPALLITVPEGWASNDGWLMHRSTLEDVTVAIQLWNVDRVFGHPCQWDGTLFRPGPTVDDLAAALVARPLRNATQPVDVALDGYAGKYLEWSVPADIDFAGCDAAPFGGHFFESWLDPGGGERYQQGPGQVDRLWILDVGGQRLVIDAFDMPSATDAERAELVNVVESIRFER